MILRPILLGLCVIMVGVTLYFGTQYASLINKLSDADQLDRAARSLLISLLDAETGQRGYIITGNPGYLTPYQAGTASIPGRLTEVEARGILTDHASVVAISALTHQKIDELDYTIKLRNEHGQQVAIQEVNRHLGKSLMDQIRQHIDDVEINCMAIIKNVGGASVWYARLTFVSFMLTLALTFPLAWSRE